eukprot:725680-Pleurochrysis_carterae.AAC.5
MLSTVRTYFTTTCISDGLASAASLLACRANAIQFRDSFKYAHGYYLSQVHAVRETAQYLCETASILI